MRILILGASGMLGNAAFRFFSNSEGFETFGTTRSRVSAAKLPVHLSDRLITNINALEEADRDRVMNQVQPDVVLNCVGLVKQLPNVDDPLEALPINSLLPHQLARQCADVGARLVHLSTDCVFSGSRGMYVETDFADANDLYGRSKFLGEVDYPNAITLRTSIIGHELAGARSLIDWFLSQDECVLGFTKAIFSGLPTVELAKIVRDHVIPFPDLGGIYHVSAEPITKHDLLQLVAEEYGKKIVIEPCDDLVIDRSLDSTRFRSATGYQPLSWPLLVEAMRKFG